MESFSPVGVGAPLRDNSIDAGRRYAVFVCYLFIVVVVVVVIVVVFIVVIVRVFRLIDIANAFGFFVVVTVKNGSCFFVVVVVVVVVENAPGFVAACSGGFISLRRRPRRGVGRQIRRDVRRIGKDAPAGRIRRRIGIVRNISCYRIGRIRRIVEIGRIGRIVEIDRDSTQMRPRLRVPGSRRA